MYMCPFTNNSELSTLTIMGRFVWLMGYKEDTPRQLPAERILP